MTLVFYPNWLIIRGFYVNLRGTDNRQEHVFIPAALCKGDIDRIQGRTNTWNNKKQTFAENRNAAGMFEPLASLPTRDLPTRGTSLTIIHSAFPF